MMQISFWNEYQWISESQNQTKKWSGSRPEADQKQTRSRLEADPPKKVEADQKQNDWNWNIVPAKIWLSKLPMWISVITIDYKRCTNKKWKPTKMNSNSKIMKIYVDRYNELMSHWWFQYFFQIVRENKNFPWNYFQDLFYRIIWQKIVGKYYLSQLNS